MHLHHGLPPYDWALAGVVIVTGLGLLLALPWMIAAQRAYKPEVAPALVRTVVLIFLAALLAGLGTLFDYWGLLAGAVVLVLGVIIPNKLGALRASRPGPAPEEPSARPHVSGPADPT